MEGCCSNKARVGREAPQFSADGYSGAKGFGRYSLSDSRGKWVVLFFYPGDFTYV